MPSVTQAPSAGASGGRTLRVTTRWPDPSTALGRPPVNTVHAVADLSREYVAVGGFSSVQQYATTLPQYIDDITQSFGADLYPRMRHDSQVESALSTLIMGTLAQGLHIGPNLRKGSPSFADSKTISDFCIQNVQRQERPILDTFREMLLGIGYGYKIAEQVYEDVDWPGFNRPLIALKHLRTKPQRSLAFVVDNYKNIIGLTPVWAQGSIQEIGIFNPGLFDPRTINATEVPPLLVPRTKFWIFSWMPENGDPRGTSILRPAYHPWWVKGQVWKAYLAYLATFAQPSIVGFISASADQMGLLDEFGNPLNTQGTPQEVMAGALAKIRDGAVGAFANDERVQVLEAKGEGQPFQLAINIANREITKAIIRQTLTTDEGEHMARAASEVHQDVFGLLLRFTRNAVAGSFLQDVIKPLVLYNFGPDAVRDFLPTCSLGDSEHQDFSQDANAIANLVRAGFFDESQYEGLDNFLGIPERDPESWAAKLEAGQALLQQAASGPPSPGNAAPSMPGQRGNVTPPGLPVAQDLTSLTARTVAKANAQRVADRIGSFGPG